MHEKERVTSARKTWRYPLLLSLSAGLSAAWGMTASTAAAQSPAGNPPAGASAPKPAAAPSTPAPAASAPKAKRKLPMRACPANVPEELNPPPDVTLETVLPATGVQSYACTIDKPGEAPDWGPKGPHAMLGEPNNLMGIHFGGPSWQAMDGSLVKGTKVSSAGAPDKSAIAWLLLSGAATGEGIFGKITHIQRMDTVGGKPPQGGCDPSHVDTRVLVPYRTNYYFYRESEPGEKVRQCRGTPKQASGEKTGDKAGGNKAGGNKAGGDKPKAVSTNAAGPVGEKPVSKPAPEKAARSTSQKSPSEKSTSDKSPSEKSAPEKSSSENSASAKSGTAKSTETASPKKTGEKSGGAKSE
ncbi:MAG: hypothetical protein RL685_2294 [Pseudomonadota bacterium]|jgi:hypothetical protein